MKNTNKIFLIICLMINTLIFIFLGYINFLFMEISTLISYFIALCVSYTYFKRVNILFLFLISFGTFNICGIFFSIFSDYNWDLNKIFTILKFSQEMKKEILISLYVFLNSICLVLILKTKTINNKKIEYKENFNYKIFLEISKLLIVFIFPVILYRKILEYNLILKLGYLYIYREGSLSNLIPWYLKGWNLIFEIAYYLFICIKPKKKEFTLITIIYIFIQILDAQKGGRGNLVVKILLIMSLYSHYYGLLISRKIIGIGLITMIFSDYISKFRSNNMISFSIFNSIKEFLLEQSSSLGIIGLNKLYKINYLKNSENTIWSPFLDSINSLIEPNIFLNQSELLAQKSYSLSVQLSYALDKKIFLSGGGVGGNLLAEIENLGGILGVFIFGIIISYLVIKMEQIENWKFIYLFTSIPIIKNLFISPRASLFPPITEVFQFLVIGFFIEFLRYSMSIKNEIINGEKK